MPPRNLTRPDKNGYGVGRSKEQAEWIPRGFVVMDGVMAQGNADGQDTFISDSFRTRHNGCARRTPKPKYNTLFKVEGER